MSHERPKHGPAPTSAAVASSSSSGLQSGYRRGRHSGLDKLDPPTVPDPGVSRDRDGHGPAEVMRDAETHAGDHLSGHAGPCAPVSARTSRAARNGVR
jgi:hypothetical protein